MTKNGKFLIKALCFSLIFLMIFFPMQELFVHKSLEEPWDMTRKTFGFYNEPEDEFSVLYFGSSHAYTAFSPLEIWHETGIKSYVFATQAQPMWATTAYLKEALKTQSPKLVILETYRLLDDVSYTDEAVTHSYMDDLPLSINKTALAYQSAPEGERLPLMLNFMKYHNRWSSLDADDWHFNRATLHDPYKGFVVLPPNAKAKNNTVDLSPTTIEEAPPISEKNLEALDEFLTICDKHNIAVWMVKTPCNISSIEKQRIQQIADFADDYAIPFDDFNTYEIYQKLHLNAQKTFFDQNHMDIVGASRFNQFFSKMLAHRYPDLPRDTEDAEWQKAYDDYQEKIQPYMP